MNASAESTSLDCSPPSRASNPFATCWTRPGALAFQFTGNASAEKIVSQLATQDWWGEIVGAHGSGKSTLLESLKPHLAAAGRQVASIALRDRQRRLPNGFLRGALDCQNPLVIVDGYEQLSRINRLILRWRCRHAGAGLIVTSHVPTGLPLLAQLQPSGALVESLVATLTAERPSAIAPADIAASHALYGSNIRELLFDLHDRHERARRTNRQAAQAVTNTATVPTAPSAACECLRS